MCVPIGLVLRWELRLLRHPINNYLLLLSKVVSVGVLIATLMSVEGAKEQQAGAASARSILCWILTAISVVTTGLHWISDVAEFIANCRIRGMRIRAAPHKMDSVFEGSFDNKPHADEGKQDNLVRPPRLEEKCDLSHSASALVDAQLIEHFLLGSREDGGELVRASPTMERSEQLRHRALVLLVTKAALSKKNKHNDNFLQRGS